jgi:formylglycine-generating enzyme required for sulfatase activity
MLACAKTVRTFATLVVAFGVAALACSSADEAGADGSGGEGSSGGVPGTNSATGPGAPKAAVGSECTTGATCESGSCKGGKCAAPAPDDAVKNGDETDVDCGGATAPKCATGKTCAAHTDCESDACAADKKCVEFRSCTGAVGGSTCGAGGNESCCTMVPIQAGGQSFRIDKYAVTAGRMRAFIERTKGDAKGWITANKPADWSDAWSDNLPSTMDDALGTVGTYEKRGCNVEFQGGRTYWQPPVDGNAKEQSDFTQDVLDAKALNCVTWHMAAALCAFDGKRLAKHAEITAVFKNGGATQYPWQFQDKTAYNPGVGDDRLNHRYNYATPNPPATLRKQPDGFALDKAFFISPPGSFPKGANKDGVQDIAGNVMPWVGDGEKQFVWTFSWEDHKGDVSKSTWTGANGGGPEGYYAIGARCAAD